MNYQPNQLVIEKEKIKHNLKEIQNLVGKNITVIPVIKNNAYQVGVAEILSILKEEKVKMVGVATVFEAINLRKLGYTEEILVLLQPCIEQIDDIVEYDIVSNVSSLSFVEKLNQKALKKEKFMKIHIEIETGMGRTGIKKEEISSFLKKIKTMKHINIEGVSTHFSCACSDENYTKKQKDYFQQVLTIWEKEEKLPKWIHASSSGAILNEKDAYFNSVRPGLMLYGYLPERKQNKKIDLKPAVFLRTQITHLQELKKGEAIGYDKAVILNRDSKIAVIPIGYADFLLPLQNRTGQVVIKNKKANILTACMDVMMVDATEIEEAEIGDEVFLWDNDMVTLEDWTKWTGLDKHHILSSLSNRIERKVRHK